MPTKEIATTMSLHRPVAQAEKLVFGNDRVRFKGMDKQSASDLIDAPRIVAPEFTKSKPSCCITLNRFICKRCLPECTSSTICQLVAKKYMRESPGMSPGCKNITKPTGTSMVREHLARVISCAQCPYPLDPEQGCYPTFPRRRAATQRRPGDNYIAKSNNNSFGFCGQTKYMYRYT